MVVTVDTLGSMTAGELEEVGMWTLVVGVTAAIRGGMSGAMLVGRTAAVGVVMSEIGLLLLLVVTCRFQRPLDFILYHKQTSFRKPDPSLLIKIIKYSKKLFKKFNYCV